MKRGEIKIENGFRDLNNNSNLLISCEIKGKIEVGNIIIIDSQKKLIILEIEQPRKDINTKVLTVSKEELDGIKLLSLYGKTFEVFS